MSEREPRPRHVDRDDVDDVVGVAQELESAATTAADRKLAVDDVKDIAGQLRIDPRYVEPAIDELARRREDEARQRAAKRASRLAAIKAAMAAVLAALVIAGSGALWTRSALGPPLAEVERHRAQVENVVDRRERIEAIWRDQPAGLDRDAELAGAENRVATERRRYDEAATDYNARAASLPHAVFCGWSGPPCRVPPSSEVEGW